MSNTRVILCLAAAGLAAAIGWSGAGEKKPVTKLPDVVAKALTNTFPQAELRAVDQNDADNPTRYEIKLRDAATGRRAELEVLADGLVVQVDEDWPEAQLPEAVLKVLQQAFPRAKLAEVQKQTRVQVSYEVDLVVEGNKREVTVSHEGKILEISKQK